MQTNQIARIALCTCDKNDTSNQEPRIMFLTCELYEVLCTHWQSLFCIRNLTRTISPIRFSFQLFIVSLFWIEATNN